jgi:hypothetical protein
MYIEFAERVCYCRTNAMFNPAKIKNETEKIRMIEMKAHRS